MLGFLKSEPIKPMQKEYDQLVERAFHAQRDGEILLYSQLTTEAGELRRKIDARTES